MADPEFAEMPWKTCDTHGDLILEKRQSGFENTGNNEGTMSQEIRVRNGGGDVLIAKEVTINWEYFGQINAEFSDDGLAVVITTSEGRDRVWQLPK